MNKFKDYMPLVYMAGTLAGLWIIKIIVRGKDDKEIKDEVQVIQNSVIPKNPNTNRVCKQSYTKEEVKALFPGWCTVVYDAKGIFKDDYPAVIGIIGKIRNRGDWYLFSNLFQLMYKKDIISYLNTFLDATEMLPINNKIRNLKC
jgi:hypothetical protein